MGCLGSSEAVHNHTKQKPQYTILVPLTSSQTNKHIDQFSMIFLHKLSDLFGKFSNQNNQLSYPEFVSMYKETKKQQILNQNENFVEFQIVQQQINRKPTKQEISEDIFERLFIYYSYPNTKAISFKNFIGKYAILRHSEQQAMANIIYFLNIDIKQGKPNEGNNRNQRMMSIKQFKKFLKDNKNLVGRPLTFPEAKKTIEKQYFYKYLKESWFLFQKYRSRFDLIQQSGFPIAQILHQLRNTKGKYYEIGQYYYIISAEWFKQWSFYYKQSSDFMYPYQDIKDHYNPNQVSERPMEITYSDIQGQFQGELSESIKDTMILAINPSLFQLLAKTLPVKSYFKRKADTKRSIDLYPRHIYYFKTDITGKIVDQSFQIIEAYENTRIGELSQLGRRQNALQEGQNGIHEQNPQYFIKKFGDQHWILSKESHSLDQCSTESKIFLVETVQKNNFLRYYKRQKKSLQNLTYGDLAYVAVAHKNMPAFILRKSGQSMYYVHFLNHSYRYQVMVDRQQLTMQKQYQPVPIENLNIFAYQGIINIGNTCFINSVLQCLGGTPIFRQFMASSNFHKQFQPLLYQFSCAIRNLSQNKPYLPYALKGVIDKQLQRFAGKDQHDAQQFLSYLFDQFSHELKSRKKNKQQQEDIIRSLFQGKMSITLLCQDCQFETKYLQSMNILSLPIPEPQQYIYTVIIFPVRAQKIQKMVFKLHNTATLDDYRYNFELRTKYQFDDYLFVENSESKNIHLEFHDKDCSFKNLKQLGVSPDVQFYAYERLPERYSSQILNEYRTTFQFSEYVDYLDSVKNQWVYARFLDINKKQTVELMEAKSPYPRQIIEKNGSKEKQQIAPLGQKTKQQAITKIYMRKYSATLQKMEIFGYYSVIIYPKVASFQQLIKLINESIKNYVDRYRKKGQPYFIRIVDEKNQKCMFCGQSELEYMKEQPKHCCDPIDIETETPLIWVTKQKQYCVYIEWEFFHDYNMDFTTDIQIDRLSINIEERNMYKKLELSNCLDLMQKPEEVQMQCTRCKHTHQKRTQLLNKTPPILILHMKQFRMLKNHSSIKLNANLKWVYYLDISKYTSDHTRCIYELYGYIKHVGTSNSGHYTCVVKKEHLFEEKSVWVKYEDDVTEMLEEQHNDLDSAYLLFFKKVQMNSSLYLNFTRILENSSKNSNGLKP